MPEQRARQHHRDRVANSFTDEITAMLEGELSDPRIAPCHVTEVVLAPGGKSCRVFLAVAGDEQAEEDTLTGMMAARGYIRSEIRVRMGVRHVPELTFAIDRTEKMNARMDDLLGRMRKRGEKLARKVAARSVGNQGDAQQSDGSQRDARQSDVSQNDTKQSDVSQSDTSKQGS